MTSCWPWIEMDWNVFQFDGVKTSSIEFCSVTPPSVDICASDGSDIWNVTWTSTSGSESSLTSIWSLGPPSDVNTSVGMMRSEEHTSELQSQSNLVCRLLLEKKNISSKPAHVASHP